MYAYRIQSKFTATYINYVNHSYIQESHYFKIPNLLVSSSDHHNPELLPLHNIIISIMLRTVIRIETIVSIIIIFFVYNNYYCTYHISLRCLLPVPYVQLHLKKFSETFRMLFYYLCLMMKVVSKSIDRDDLLCWRLVCLKLFLYCLQQKVLLRKTQQTFERR